jgi:hypothetical protein
MSIFKLGNCLIRASFICTLVIVGSHLGVESIAAQDSRAQIRPASETSDVAAVVAGQTITLVS